MKLLLLGGYVNKQNCRIWGTENPHAYIGPFFFENVQGEAVTANDDSYRSMLKEFLFTKVEEKDVGNNLLFNFYKQKFVRHGPITIAIGCNGLFLLIFKEKWPNYASGPKSAPNNDSFWVRWLFNACVRVFCAPNAIILLVYIPTKIKMSFI